MLHMLDLLEVITLVTSLFSLLLCLIFMHVLWFEFGRVLHFWLIGMFGGILRFSLLDFLRTFDICCLKLGERLDYRLEDSLEQFGDFMYSWLDWSLLNFLVYL